MFIENTVSYLVTIKMIKIKAKSLSGPSNR